MAATITSLAFVAAYDAAMKAGNALELSQASYDMELQPRFGAALCTSKDHSRARVWIYVISIDNIDDGRIPAGYSEDQFEPIGVDFENLGRSALIDVWVEVEIVYERARPIRINVGNIAANKAVHANIYFVKGASTLPRIICTGICWIDKKQVTYAPPAPILLRPLITMGEAPKWEIRVSLESPDAVPAVDSPPNLQAGSSVSQDRVR